VTDNELEQYLRGLELVVEAAQDSSGHPYIVVRKFVIPCGPLAGRTCHVALARCQTIPYVVPPAIHICPALVPMDIAGPNKTQQSALGLEWQYWSRRFDRAPSPQAVWTHVLTVFSQVIA
jgi:hypothetical protein